MNIFKKYKESRRPVYYLKDNLGFPYRDYVINEYAPHLIGAFVKGSDPLIGAKVEVIQDGIFIRGYTTSIIRDIETRQAYIVLDECLEEIDEKHI